MAKRSKDTSTVSGANVALFAGLAAVLVCPIRHAELCASRIGIKVLCLTPLASQAAS